MSFPRRLLHEGESVLIDRRPHWTSVVRPGLMLAASLAVALVIQAGVGSDADHKDLLLIPALGVVVLMLGLFVVRYARWACSHLIVTTDRLIVRSGVILRRGREVPLDQVAQLTPARTLFGRMTGSGTLTVESRQGGREVFPNCPDPVTVHDQVQRLVDAARDRDADSRLSGEPSPLAQLEKLAELHQRGVISQSEFDAKKAQLLDRL